MKNENNSVLDPVFSNFEFFTDHHLVFFDDKPLYRGCYGFFECLGGVIL
jgi:hypothetical protein